MDIKTIWLYTLHDWLILSVNSVSMKLLKAFYGMNKWISSSTPNLGGGFFFFSETSFHTNPVWSETPSDPPDSMSLVLGLLVAVTLALLHWLNLSLLIVSWLLGRQARQDGLQDLVTRPRNGQLMAPSSYSLCTPNLLSPTCGLWMQQEICRDSQRVRYRGAPNDFSPPCSIAEWGILFIVWVHPTPCNYTTRPPLCVSSALGVIK